MDLVLETCMSKRLSRPRSAGDVAHSDTIDSTPHANYPYADIASAARRGRFFGLGPKGYRRSDERIREEICDRLMTHPDIDASDIELSVNNGVVVMNGTVEDRHEKRLAEYLAEDVLGVDDVDNRLKVRHGFWATVVGERAMERELPRHE
jgi:osmotically-inducible protein OsmY